jgi:hypothetical protein
LEQILSRMEQVRSAEHNSSVPYTVTREYQLAAQGATEADSKVVAQVSFTPPGAKDYAIMKEQGGGRGGDVVRKVLAHESEMAGHAQAHELSAQNYSFALAGRETIDGHDCYVLQLMPKRDSADLVRGKAWVDIGNFEIRRIAGQTAKSPSFWIKNLNVTVNYGAVNGVWVQTSSRAVADVRMAGPHVLTSRSLQLQTATFDARAHTSSKAHNQRSNAHRAVADAATWVPR